MSISVTENESLSKADLRIVELAVRGRQINPPKRGRQPESRSDARNGLIRSAVDHVVGASVSKPMAEAYKVGAALFENACYLCGYALYRANGASFSEKALSPQADHILPHSHGGAGAAGHLLPTHNVCNNAKGNWHFEEYLADRPRALALVKEFMELYSVRQLMGLHQAVSQAADEALAVYSQKLVEIGAAYDLVVPPYTIVRKPAAVEPDLPPAVLAKLKANQRKNELANALQLRLKVEAEVVRALRAEGIAVPSNIYTVAEGKTNA